jgi:membrane protein CcdC involved in cytochrome C biogenesis
MAMNATTLLIAVAVIVLLMVRRFMGEPLEARRLILPPVILVILGGYSLSQIDFPAAAQHPVTDGAVLGLGAVVAVLGGVVRGLTVRVFVQNGHVWYRYTLVTLAVWLGLVVLRIGQLFAGRALHADQAVLSAGLLLVLGLSFLGEAAIVGRRAIATGAPFAPRGARRAARG